MTAEGLEVGFLDLEQNGEDHGVIPLSVSVADSGNNPSDYNNYNIDESSHSDLKAFKSESEISSSTKNGDCLHGNLNHDVDLILNSNSNLNDAPMDMNACNLDSVNFDIVIDTDTCTGNCGSGGGTDADVDSSTSSKPNNLSLSFTTCLICSKTCKTTDSESHPASINVEDNKENYPAINNKISENVLHNFSKVFKVSTTIYQDIDLNSLDTPLFCHSCSQKVFDCINVLVEIERLEKYLDHMRDEIKGDLFQGYKHLLKGQGQLTETRIVSSRNAKDRIRKAFAQCWTKSVVPIDRISPSKPGSDGTPDTNTNNSYRITRTSNRIRTKSIYRIKTKSKTKALAKMSMSTRIINKNKPLKSQFGINDYENNNDLSDLELGDQDQDRDETNYCNDANYPTYPTNQVDQKDLSNLMETKVGAGVQVILTEKKYDPNPNANLPVSTFFSTSTGSFFTRYEEASSFQCEFCKRIFCKEDYRIETSKRTENPYLFTCDLPRCKTTKPFKCFFRFQRHHMSTCRFRPSYPCEYCDRRCFSDKSLKEHYRARHSDRPEPTATNPSIHFSTFIDVKVTSNKETNYNKDTMQNQTRTKIKNENASSSTVPMEISVNDQDWLDMDKGDSDSNSESDAGSLYVPDVDGLDEEGDGDDDEGNNAMDVDMGGDIGKIASKKKSRKNRCRKKFNPTDDNTNAKEQDDSESFQCEFCERVFYKEDYRVETSKENSNQNSYLFTCDLPRCKTTKPFKRFSRFQRHHLSTCRFRPSYACQYCERRCFSDKSLKEHYKARHFGMPEPQASEPSVHYSTFTDVRVTPKVKSCQIDTQSSAFPRVQSFECEFCNRVFNREDFKTESGDYIFLCDLPNCKTTKPFLSLPKLKQHHRNNCLSRPSVSCEYCGKLCYDDKTLKHHIISHHTKEFEFTCHHCGMGLPTLGGLKGHLLTHAKERQYKCSHCPKSFKKKYDLSIHEERHGERILCEVCGKGMKCRRDLNNHKFIHASEKNFSCRFCNKFFKSRAYVDTHIWNVHKKARKPRVKPNKDIDISNFVFTDCKNVKMEKETYTNLNTIDESQIPALISTSVFNSGDVQVQIPDVLNSKM